jgi:putative SOS response-associated peptidase YedK
MVGIHNRMPVILSPDEQEAWLDPNNQHAESLLRPCQAEEMEAYAVSAIVGNPRNEGPELIVPLTGLLPG